MNGERFRGFVASLVLTAFVLCMMACGVDTGVGAIDVAKNVMATTDALNVKGPTNGLVKTDEVAKFLSDDTLLGDAFAASIAFSEDGLTAIMGAPGDDDNGMSFGAAYIFVWSGGSWMQTTKLTANDGVEGDAFGYSVALSGNTALVGIRHINGKGSVYVFVRSGTTWTQQAKLTDSNDKINDGFGISVALSGDTALVGAVGNECTYVFVRSGTTWTQQAKLTANDGGAYDGFGSSVALSGDTVLVGAVYDDDKGFRSGSAYVFVRNGVIWTQQAKFTADDGTAYDYFGGRVALSSNTALVGARWNDEKGHDSGSAYVFVRNGTTWMQQAKLTASDAGVGDEFGYSLALSGETALVGAYGDDDKGINSGSAYVFARNGTNWMQQAKLTANDGAPRAYFGNEVAVSGDTALVGAIGYDNIDIDSGSVYYFSRNGTMWTQQSKFTSNDGAPNDYFGTEVALSGDTALVGAPGDDDDGTDSGSACIFVRSGTMWTRQSKFTANDGTPNVYFGGSVALSGDTALVGAPGDGANGTDSGFAYIFVRSGTTWTQQAKLTSNDGAPSDYFGNKVALSGDTALVGARYDDDKGADSGSVYIFVRNGTTWTQQAKLTADDGAEGDLFGCSVALSGDTVLVGARQNHGKDFGSGAAYIFERSGTAWTQQVKLTANDGEVVDYFGWAVALSGDTALVGAAGDDIGPHIDQGSAYVFTRDANGTWIQQQQLVANDGTASDGFGNAVALSGDTALVGAYQDGDNGQLFGSAYIFERSGTTWTQQTKITSSDSTPYGGFGTSAALSEDGSIGLASAPYEHDNGSVYVLSITRSLGLTCAGGAACSSGFCVDGVCCNAPCNGPCQACAASKQAFGTDGYCGPAAEGTNPGNHCPDSRTSDPNSCGTDGFCSAIGTCRVYAYETPCAANVCNNNSAVRKVCNGVGSCVGSSTDCGDYTCTNGACNTTCATDTDCVPQAHCNQGACELDQNPGTTCTDDAQCASGSCVSGTCCNADCQVDAMNPCGYTGTCNAFGACEIPKYGEPCKVGESVCTGGLKFSKQICNGLGTCVPNPNSLESCGAYQCDDATSACKTDCVTKDDCAAGFKCSDNECIAANECKTASDCAIDEVCDETRRCVKKDLAITPDVYDDACTCSLPGQTSNNSAKPLLTLTLLALFMRRKNHS